MRKRFLGLLLVGFFVFPHQGKSQEVSQSTIDSILSLMSQIVVLAQNPQHHDVAQVMLQQVVELLATAQGGTDSGSSENDASDLISENFGVEDKFLVLYEVQNDELVFRSGEVDQADLAAWDLFQKASDNDVREDFVSFFALIEDNESDLVAFVSESPLTEKWILVVNIEEFDVEADWNDAVNTLVHEFAHILSFNDDQVPDVFYGICPTWYVAEGCPSPRSYYQKFLDAFWTIEDRLLIEDYVTLEEEEQFEVLYDWYLERPGQFVTEYAATSPGEDFAESFTFFILEKELEEDGELIQQKISFFEQFPELQVMKVTINNQLAE